jgi:hypothetical protein
MKTVKLAIYIFLLFFGGMFCARKPDHAGTKFSIGGYLQEFKFEDIVSDFKPLALSTDGEFVLGRIKDICFTDKRIYVLDATTASVFIFDKENGAMIKAISQRGAGPNEYITPWAIDCDSSHVWLLDMPSKKIITYDVDLNVLGAINIPHVAFDFIHTGAGFLLRLAQLRTYKFVHIDLNGNEIAKYIPITPANEDAKSSYGDAVEMLQVGSRSFFCDGYRSRIYVLSDSMQESYEVDFGELNIPDDVNPNNYNILQNFPYVYKPKFFLISNCLIVDFFAPNDNNRYYSFINLSTGASFSGYASDIENTPPFYPQKQDGKHLVGWFTYGDILQNKTVVSQLSETLNVSGLDYDNPILIFYTLNLKLHDKPTR